jgi:hypothetical protein
MLKIFSSRKKDPQEGQRSPRNRDEDEETKDQIRPVTFNTAFPPDNVTVRDKQTVSFQTTTPVADVISANNSVASNRPAKDAPSTPQRNQVKTEDSNHSNTTIDEDDDLSQYYQNTNQQQIVAWSNGDAVKPNPPSDLGVIKALESLDHHNLELRLSPYRDLVHTIHLPCMSG